MVDAVRGVVGVHAVHVLDVATEEAVLADGDAVGLVLLEAEEDADGLGLLGGLDVVDAVDDERPFRVLLEEGALVELLARPLVLERGLVDLRRGRVQGIGEGGVTLADGAMGDPLDGVTHQQPRGEDAAGLDDESKRHAYPSFRLRADACVHSPMERAFPWILTGEGARLSAEEKLALVFDSKIPPVYSKLWFSMECTQ